MDTALHIVTADERRYAHQLNQRVALERLFHGRPDGLWSIGQLTKDETRLLAWGVLHGEVLKRRLCWPWIAVGTCVKTHFTYTPSGQPMDDGVDYGRS